MKDVEVGLRREAARRRLAGESPEVIARELGRTRQWVAKWAARYDPHDPGWAHGRSRAPKRVAQRTRAEVAAAVLEVGARHALWTRHGVPGRVQFDNGGPFSSPTGVGEVVRFCVHQGTVPVFIPPREPW